MNVMTVHEHHAKLEYDEAQIQLAHFARAA
jgi:hypothetical protein